MALKTFTATRAPAAGDGKRLTSVHLSAGGVACIVNLCDGTSATPIIQIQVPINSSFHYSFNQSAPVFPNSLHVELVSGTFVRGAIDI